MPSIGPTRTGTVKTFDPIRGFGFIAIDSGAEIYFHATGIESDKPLAVGDRVKFVQGYSRDGRTRARNVAVLQTVGSRA
jgi:cold shock CspA family protein